MSQTRTPDRNNAPNRIVVAVDVDGVLGEQAPHLLAWAKRTYNVDMTKSQITSWNPQVGPRFFSEYITELLKNPEFVHTMPLVEGAREGVAHIRERANVLIATNTPFEGEPARREWLEKNFGSELDFINTHGRDKGCVKARVLIDDFTPNLMDFVSKNHGSIGILVQQPWNKASEHDLDALRWNSDGTPSGRIYLAKDWTDIVRHIDTILAQQAGTPRLNLYFAHPFDHRAECRKLELSIEQATGVSLLNPFYDCNRPDVEAIDRGDRKPSVEKTVKEVAATDPTLHVRTVENDLKRIDDSNGIVAVVMRKWDSFSVGTILEAHHARQAGKHVIIYTDSPGHHWLRYYATHISTTPEDLEAYLRKLQERGGEPKPQRLINDRLPPRPRVALDLDGTLADVHGIVLPKWSRMTRKQITKEMCLGWNGLNQVTENPNASKDYVTVWEDYPAEMIEAIEPNVGELTQALSTMADVDVVTSHTEPSRNNIARWLQLNGIAYHQLLLVGADTTEGEAARRQGADKTCLPYDVFIDDNGELSKLLSPPRMLIIFSQPWNLHAQEQPGKTARITSLAQAPALLTTLNEGCGERWGDQGEIIKYSHYGKDVFVDANLKGHHRNHCLCYRCSKFHPGVPALNCSIAQENYAMCVKHGLTLPVWECPAFAQKNSVNNE